MTKFFNQNGKSLELLQWAKMFDQYKMRNLAKTRVRGFLVSTIWVGFNQEPLSPIPLIFETGLLDRDGYCATVGRYATKAGALKGHGVIVENTSRELAGRTRRKALYHQRRR